MPLHIAAGCCSRQAQVGAGMGSAQPMWSSAPAPVLAGGIRAVRVVCAAAARQLQHSPPRRRRHICPATAAGDGKLPRVDDPLVLPPPAQGSQYAWRSNWGAFSSAGGGDGGNGGGQGRGRQPGTRDWGAGGPAGRGVLFMLMYRMRLLLLYGVWVTVLYGAVRAVLDVTHKAGSGLYALASSTAELLVGTSSGSSGGGSPGGEAAVEPDAAAVGGAAAGTAVGGAQENDGQGAGGSTPSSPNAVFAAAAASRLQERPTARVFQDLTSAVIPLYLMLLGSVVFFASM